MKDNVASRIEDRSAVIGVIGLGYVGLPLLAAFHQAGYPVIGFDVDPKKVELLLRGENYLKHLGVEMVKQMLAAGRFQATTDMARLGEADAIIVCVPTPWASTSNRMSRSSKKPPTTSPPPCAPASSSSWKAAPIPAPPAKSCSPASKPAA